MNAPEFWELDPAECSGRRRLRLRRNPWGSSHADNAAEATKVAAAEAEARRMEEEQQAREALENDAAEQEQNENGVHPLTSARLLLAQLVWDGLRYTSGALLPLPVWPTEEDDEGSGTGLLIEEDTLGNLMSEGLRTPLGEEMSPQLRDQMSPLLSRIVGMGDLMMDELSLSQSGGNGKLKERYSGAVELVRPFVCTAGRLTLNDQWMTFEPGGMCGSSTPTTYCTTPTEQEEESSLSRKEGSLPRKEGSLSRKESYVSGKEFSVPEKSHRWALRPAESTAWQLSRLVRAAPCPNLHQITALELFFRRPSMVVRLHLPSNNELRTLLKALARCKDCRKILDNAPWRRSGYWRDPAPAELRSLGDGNASMGNALPSATCAWQARKMSNFDYLMTLNAAAGRGYTHLSHHPIFPWVVSDWESEELDLTNPASFRDLAWPMGAQGDVQRQTAHQRHADLATLQKDMLRAEALEGRINACMPPPTPPPFHHGSHYSTAGFVLWYLLRLEPYTSLHVHLQDGHFDVADRLFSSVADAYASGTGGAGDNKEAVPELYYLPEMLINSSHLPLGTSQSGVKVDDVELPPWAKGDPWTFIKIHRDALESEYVSQHLHLWIDLIFGYRQRGKMAVKALNVFYHLTYPGAVDLEYLKRMDAQLYAATISQMEEFGQTPPQLFQTPHPQRPPLTQSDIMWPAVSQVPGASSILPGTKYDRPSKLTVHTYPYPPLSEDIKTGAPIAGLALMQSAERFLIIDANGQARFHVWQQLSPEMEPSFRLKRPTFIGDGGTEVEKNRLKRQGCEHMLLSNFCALDLSSKSILVCGGGGENGQEGAAFTVLNLDQPSGSRVYRMRSGLQCGDVNLQFDDNLQSAGATNNLQKDDVSRKDSDVSVSIPRTVREEDDDSSIRVCADSSAEEEQHGDIPTSTSPESTILTTSVAIDTCANRCCIGACDGCIEVWNWPIEEGPDIGEPLYRLNTFMASGSSTSGVCVALSGDAGLLVIGYGTCIEIRDLWGTPPVMPGGGLIRTINIEEEGQEESFSISWIATSPNSTIIAVYATRNHPSTDSGTCDTTEVKHNNGVRIHTVTNNENNKCNGDAEHAKHKNKYRFDSTTKVSKSSACGMLVAFSVNGHVYARRYESVPITAACFSEDGNVLVIGDSAGSINLLDAQTLDHASSVVTTHVTATENISITSLAPAERHLLVGASDGSIMVLTPDAQYLRDRFQRRLKMIGLL